ncbi:MAG: allophanate hydrolase subunit 1 [Cypionkella sp.]|uniref:5-oxoprolinase subunit B family protein n=1 Tax=Cypionkella sp. TaxID=2811411 RepID=UPI002AB94650|nr:allophanate hydrolase subunit 1 [Cypionkella sp.]MDZ4312290.1 allophanate hydrolase subunit 1 [Cypionkella sp.]
MHPTPSAPIFRSIAERAVLVEFGTVLDQAAHDAVLRLDQALAAQPFVGFREAIPAFVNLLVEFDPVTTDHPTTIAHLRGLLTAQTTARAQPAQREVLVCYDADLAPDLVAVAQATGLTPEAVINAHLSGDYAVFMYGFAPGYAYLGGVPEVIRLDRKPSPLRGVAAGSVIIAGAQCLVTTLLMPTGWWIIGRSPTRILTDDTARPFLFDVGDKVRFRRIRRAEYEAEQ